MSEAKFTPGPWEWVEISDQWDGKTTHFVSGDKSVLCGWGHDACGIHVKEPDAHLIAAAPDMYEALKDVEWETDGFCPQCSKSRDSDGHSPRCILANALAKARGEAR